MVKLKIWHNNAFIKILTVVLMVFVVGLAEFLRIYNISKLPLWHDEIFSYYAAASGLRNIMKIDPNMGLFQFFAHFWVRIVSKNDGELRILPAIFSIVNIPVVFLLGSIMSSRKMKSISIGFMAALLVAVNAFHIQYAQEFRAYSLVVLLTTLSTYLLIKAVEHKPTHTVNSYWLWFAIVSSAAIYSHFFAFFILIAQIVSLVILHIFKIRALPFKGFVASCTIIFCLTIYVLVAVLTKGFQQISWLKVPTVNDVIIFGIEITGNQGPVLLILYLLITCISFLILINEWLKKEYDELWKFMIIANCFVFPVVLSLIFSKIFRPIFLGRYLIEIMPYMAILASNGVFFLITMGRNNTLFKLFAILLGLGILVTIIVLSTEGMSKYFQYFEKEDWRSASKFLSKNCSKHLRLYYAPSMERNATYYDNTLTSQIINWNNELAINVTAKSLLEQLVNNYNGVCLVLGHVDTQNKSGTLGVIQNILQNNFPKLIKKDFYQVQIHIYTF